MEGPDRLHSYAITIDGDHPDDPPNIQLYADTHDEARREAADLARRFGIDQSKVRIWYQLQLVARSDWTEVGETADYGAVFDRLARDLQRCPRE